MRIRDKINKKKLSHYMFNDEEIVCMNKKYFNDNYISKDKIRDKIKEITDKTANIGLFIDKETSIIANAKREVLKELIKER